MTTADKTFLWIQHGGERAWACGVTEILRELGFDSTFKCFMVGEAAQYRAAGFEAESITWVLAEPDLSTDELLEVERQFAPPTLADIALSDAHLRVMYGAEPSPAAIQIVAKLLRYWEMLFARDRPRAVVVRDRASIWCRTAAAVAERQNPGIKILQLGLGPDDSRFALYDAGPQPSWRALKPALDRRLAAGPLSQARRREIDDFVARRLPSSDQPMQLKRRGPGGLRMVPFVLRRIADVWQARRRRSREPYVDAFPTLALHLILQNMRWHYFIKHVFRYSLPRKEKYVFFPLFHREELINLLNTRFWCENVVELIRYVASTLPADHVLYVKEHPVVLGDLTWRDLRALRRIPRVRLIHPATRSSHLVRDASAVLVCGGTGGWEGFLSRKPVVVLGMCPYYSENSLVRNVTDINELGSSLYRAVVEGFSAAQEDEWYAFIDCVLHTTTPGRFEKYEYPHTPDHSRANLEKVAQALVSSADNR